jgi:hypothetical protein
MGNKKIHVLLFLLLLENTKQLRPPELASTKVLIPPSTHTPAPQISL